MQQWWKLCAVICSKGPFAYSRNVQISIVTEEDQPNNPEFHCNCANWLFANWLAGLLDTYLS